MISKEIEDLIHRWAKAEQAYASEWSQNYESGHNVTATNMMTDMSPLGYQKMVLEKQLEYLMSHNAQDNKDTTQD